MTSGDYAFLVSGFSLAIALAALVWGIWGKFIFVKPQVQVAFGVYRVFQGGEWGKQLLDLTVTNMGPGPVIIHSCIAKMRPKRFWKTQFGILNPIHNDPTDPVATSVGPFSGGLPAKLDAGEVKSFYFPFTEETFLSHPMLRVGVTDTYGRYVWCSGKAMKPY